MKSIGKGILIFLGIFVIVATVLPIVQGTAWWIRVFDFPRIQFAVLGVVVAVLLLLLGERRLLEKSLLLLVATSILYQGILIYPYTPPAQEQVLEQQRKHVPAIVSLFVSNVRMTNRNFDAFLEIVDSAEADLLVILEPDSLWEEQLRTLETRYPYAVKHPLANTYGIILYSKLKLLDPQVRFLIKKSVPSIRSLVQLRSGDLLELYCVHPEPPHPVKEKTTAERDAELLIVAKEVDPATTPVIVAGDLNDVAWSHTTRLFQEISGLLDPRIGRGLFNTYHAEIPAFRFPIDHVFVSSHFRLIEIKRLGYFGSDHFPMYLSLSFEPGGKRMHGPPEPSRAEREEAETRIEEGIEEGH